jgi:hypothetical protein
MKQAEWRVSNEPAKMLKWLRRKRLDRKFRLFSCACCRRIWALLPDITSRVAVEMAERFVEGHANRLSLRRSESARCANLHPV